MARFDRMRYDYRGPEYDARYGRYEAAFARRYATERRELERAQRLGRYPFDRRHPGRRLPYDDEYLFEDVEYTRRYVPPALRRSRRMY